MVLKNDEVYDADVYGCLRISGHKVRCRIHDWNQDEGDGSQYECDYLGTVTLKGEYVGRRTYGADCYPSEE